MNIASTGTMNGGRSLLAFLRVIYEKQELIFHMIYREVVGRYKGSIFGLAWSFLNPFLMLLIYTFVFSEVFNSRWGSSPSNSKTEFAILVFVGLIIQGLFAEVINRAPQLIVGNINYVKKVVFPLEILPLISIGAATFHATISYLILMGAILFIDGALPWTAIFLPLLMFPLIFFLLGFSWFFSSLGVYVRDVGQMMGALTTIVMFLSPVFYPVKALPYRFQSWMNLNPLTFVIEEVRAVLIFGEIPNFYGLGIYSLCSIVIMFTGYAWFQFTKKGFADVL